MNNNAILTVKFPDGNIVVSHKPGTIRLETTVQYEHNHGSIDDIIGAYDYALDMDGEKGVVGRIHRELIEHIYDEYEETYEFILTDLIKYYDVAVGNLINAGNSDIVEQQIDAGVYLGQFNKRAKDLYRPTYLYEYEFNSNAFNEYLKIRYEPLMSEVSSLGKFITKHEMSKFADTELFIGNNTSIMYSLSTSGADELITFTVNTYDRVVGMKTEVIEEGLIKITSIDAVCAFRRNVTYTYRDMSFKSNRFGHDGGQLSSFRDMTYDLLNIFPNDRIASLITNGHFITTVNMDFDPISDYLRIGNNIVANLIFGRIISNIIDSSKNQNQDG